MGLGYYLYSSDNATSKFINSKNSKKFTEPLESELELNSEADCLCCACFRIGIFGIVSNNRELE